MYVIHLIILLDILGVMIDNKSFVFVFVFCLLKVYIVHDVLLLALQY